MISSLCTRIQCIVPSSTCVIYNSMKKVSKFFSCYFSLFFCNLNFDNIYNFVRHRQYVLTLTAFAITVSKRVWSVCEVNIIYFYNNIIYVILTLLIQHSFFHSQTG